METTTATATVTDLNPPFERMMMMMTIVSACYSGKCVKTHDAYSSDDLGSHETAPLILDSSTITID
jgi:hypothetical protein